MIATATTASTWARSTSTSRSRTGATQTVGGAPTIRNQRVTDNVPLVRHVVGRLLRRLPSRYEADELVQWGVCGLLHAAQAFDENRGVAFSTFAYRRIQGAILDELRKADVRTRTERRRDRQIEEATRKIEEEHQRPARAEEIAAASGLSLRNVHALLGRGRRRTISLQAESGDSNAPYGLEAVPGLLTSRPEDGPEARALFAERKRLLADAIAKLPERERRVIVLYYYKGLRIREIAAVLTVTEGRISQLHTRALGRMAEVISRREGGRK